jgi:hypothetical protein
MDIFSSTILYDIDLVTYNVDSILYDKYLIIYIFTLYSIGLLLLSNIKYINTQNRDIYIIKPKDIWHTTDGDSTVPNSSAGPSTSNTAGNNGNNNDDDDNKNRVKRQHNLSRDRKLERLDREGFNAKEKEKIYRGLNDISDYNREKLSEFFYRDFFNFYHQIDKLGLNKEQIDYMKSCILIDKKLGSLSDRQKLCNSFGQINLRRGKNAEIMWNYIKRARKNPKHNLNHIINRRR